MPRSRCLQKAITVWGWTFDLFTVAINITDVVSDVLVAIQFFEDGHTTWFWLVVSSLILSNIIYTILAAEIMIDHRVRATNFMFHTECWMRPLLWALVFPFAQLAPTLNWALTVCSKADRYDQSDIDHIQQRYDELSGVSSSKVDEEATADVENQMHVMASLELALKKHFKTHLLFYVETMVESIPQSVIQLLAITFLGQATGLQIFSMSLSLISIVSKAYVVSHSFTIKTMVFKFMLVAHDLFSLFYIFSTLLSKDESADVELGSLNFNYLSYIWILRMCVYLGCGVIGAIITLAIITSDEMRTRISGVTQYNCSWKVVREFLLVVVVGVLGAAPAVLAAEGAKLVWIIFGLRQFVEPHEALFPHYSYMYTFVQSGSWAERIKFILAEYTETYMDVAINDTFLEDVEVTEGLTHSAPSWLKKTSRAPKGAKLVKLTPAQRQKYFTRIRNSHFGGILVNQVRMVLNGGIVFDDSQAERDIVAATLYAPGSVWRERRKAESMSPYSSITKTGEAILAALMTIAAVIYTIGQLFSFFFPFINYGVNYHHQNLLQHFCFVAMMVSLLVVAIVTPSVMTYISFCKELDVIKDTHWQLISGGHVSTFTKSVVHKYHVPPQRQLLLLSVPFTLLPPDVVGVVDSLMELHSLDLSSLSAADCHLLKDRWDAHNGDGVDALTVNIEADPQ